MGNLFFDNFLTGFNQVLTYLNWGFIIPLMIMLYLFLRFAWSEKYAIWLNWARKLPRWIWALIFTFTWLIVFAYFFRFDKREDFFSLIVSSIAVAFIYNVLGLKKGLELLTEKWNKK